MRGGGLNKHADLSVIDSVTEYYKKQTGLALALFLTPSHCCVKKNISETKSQESVAFKPC